MPNSVASTAANGHPVLPDIGKPQMAKVHVRKPDVDWSTAIGVAVQRAVASVGWSNKEAAAKVGADDAEFGKWLSGGRRPQFDKLFAVEELRQPLVVALAELSEGVEVVTEIRFKRSA